MDVLHSFLTSTDVILCDVIHANFITIMMTFNSHLYPPLLQRSSGVCFIVVPLKYIRSKESPIADGFLLKWLRSLKNQFFRAFSSKSKCKTRVVVWLITCCLLPNYFLKVTNCILILPAFFVFQFTSWVDAVIFVFSLENEASFSAIYNYYVKMSQFRNMQEIPLILVGTQGIFQILPLVSFFSVHFPQKILEIQWKFPPFYLLLQHWAIK